MWSLPLIAHEFGHVVQNEDNYAYLKEGREPILEVLRKSSSTDEDRVKEEFEEYVADSFATYVMGPAYACAAIHVRLNPAAAEREPNVERRYDRERAEVILGTLRMMNEETKVTQEYWGILNRLEAHWNEMVRGVDPDWTGDTDVWKARRGVLDQVVQWLWQKYRSGNDNQFIKLAIYPHNARGEGWSIAKNWKYDLEKSQLSNVTKASMLRDALNAGWTRRIDEETDDLRNQGNELLKLCKKIVETRASGGSAAPLQRQGVGIELFE